MPASLRVARVVRRMPLGEREMWATVQLASIGGGEGGEGKGERVSVVGSGIYDEVFYLGASLEAVLASPGVLVVDFHGNDCWLRCSG